jgi:hypothetical protein
VRCSLFASLPDGDLANVLLELLGSHSTIVGPQRLNCQMLRRSTAWRSVPRDSCRLSVDGIVSSCRVEWFSCRVRSLDRCESPFRQTGAVRWRNATTHFFNFFSCDSGPKAPSFRQPGPTAQGCDPQCVPRPKGSVIHVHREQPAFQAFWLWSPFFQGRGPWLSEWMGLWPESHRGSGSSRFRGLVTAL